MTIASPGAAPSGGFFHFARATKVLWFLSNLAEKAGHLLRTAANPHHLSTSCGDGGGEGAAPCSCPSGLADTYTVSGFGGLSPCALCDPATDPVWPGTMYQTGTACLWWALDEDFDPFSINGVSLDITYTQVLLRTTVSPCRWELYIACGSLTNPTQTMWAGYKTTGSSPVGVYEFVASDCGNTTATMNVA